MKSLASSLSGAALRRWGAVLLVVVVATGCATSRSATRGPRAFEFQRDTFAYANGLVWEYYFDADGKWTHRRREPAADYTHHCFVVACAAQQFFQHARFDASQSKVDEAAYRRLVRAVIRRSPRRASTEARRIVIPGYADLRSFSAAHEALLKTECGGAWESYVQRGHWRMIFPISRSWQAKVARKLVESLQSHPSAVLHVVRFPQLTINHAVLAYEVSETAAAIDFTVYDPNKPEQPAHLTFDRASRTFEFPTNDYFMGGRVDVYEVYRGLLY